LLKGAAETLTGTIADGAGDLDPKQIAAASKMLQLIQLAMNAKKSCGDMKGLADTCSDFAKNPSLESASSAESVGEFPRLGELS
jgi:hypothetical protein